MSTICHRKQPKAMMSIQCHVKYGGLFVSATDVEKTGKSVHVDQNDEASLI